MDGDMDLANWKKFQRHPLSELFDDMAEAEFQAMLDDMKEHGYDPKHPIMLYDNQVLDGWNRIRCAILAKVTPTFDTYKGKDPLGFVVRANLHRRHWDASQRAMAASRITTYTHGGDRRSQGANLPQGTTVADAANLLNVSERSVKTAAVVISRGTEELQKAVSDGTLSVSDAAAVAKKPKRTQTAAVKAVRNGKAKTAREAIETAVKGDADEGPLEKIKDADGTDVPEDAMPAFQAAKDIESFCRKLDQFHKDLEQHTKMEGWQSVHAASTLQNLKNVRQHLWSNRATHVCPYKKHDATCACKGRRWVTKAVYNQAPKD